MKNGINIPQKLEEVMGAKLSPLRVIIKGYFALTGKFSVTNLSRWVIGQSVRSIERFYGSPQDWVFYSFELIKMFLLRQGSRVLGLTEGWCLLADETVDKKSGHLTHGLGYHYSSKADKVIKSISVLNLSLAHCETKLSLPICQEQLLYPEKVKAVCPKKDKGKKKADKKATKGKKEGKTVKKKVGRPKGSKNKPKGVEGDAQIAYTFQVLGTLLSLFMTHFTQYLSSLISFEYVVGDGGFGNNTVACQVRALNKHLISKLQYNAALYLPFTGTYKGNGRPQKYGDKLNYETIPDLFEDNLVQKQVQKDGSVWHIYQFKSLHHKAFDMPLNVVIIFKYDKNGIRVKKAAQVVLFSTNTQADFSTIIRFYQVRFQIEFNFRDARQFFGLSHFKNVKQTQVTNVIHAAFFMTTLANIMLFELKQQNPTVNLSIQDLKAFFRAEKYLNELLNTHGNDPALFLNLNLIQNMPIVGAINSD